MCLSAGAQPSIALLERTACFRTCACCQGIWRTLGVRDVVIRQRTRRRGHVQTFTLTVKRDFRWLLCVCGQLQAAADTNSIGSSGRGTLATPLLS